MKLSWDLVGNWELTICNIEIILGPSWELGAYNLQHRGYPGTRVEIGNLNFCNTLDPAGGWELGS